MIPSGSGSPVTKITDYVSGFQYEDADGEGTQASKQLVHLQHARGRCVWEQGEFHYQYNLTDHLGNVRVVFGDGDHDGRINPDPVAGLDVVQVVRGYYPFGARHGSDLSTVAPPENQYLYNGKEMQDELTLGWYDYGARMYDPTVGRWNGVDALAEFRSEMSPFNYVSNSPLNRIDPDGRLDTRTVAMNAYMTTPDGQNARFTRSKSEEEEPEDDFVEVEYLEMVAMDPTTGNHTFTRREFQHEYVEEPYVSRATGAIRYKTRRKYKGYVEYEVVVSPDGKIISAKKIDGNKKTEMTLSEVMYERSDFALLVYDSSNDIATGNKKKSYNYEGYYNLGYHHLENGTVLDDFNNLSGGVAIGTGFIDKMVSSGNLSLAVAEGEMLSLTNGYLWVFSTWLYAGGQAINIKKKQALKGARVGLNSGRDIIRISE